MRRAVSWCQCWPPFGVGTLLVSRVAANAALEWPARRYMSAESLTKARLSVIPGGDPLHVEEVMHELAASQ